MHRPHRSACTIRSGDGPTSGQLRGVDRLRTGRPRLPIWSCRCRHREQRFRDVRRISAGQSSCAPVWISPVSVGPPSKPALRVYRHVARPWRLLCDGRGGLSSISCACGRRSHAQLRVASGRPGPAASALSVAMDGCAPPRCGTACFTPARRSSRMRGCSSDRLDIGVTGGQCAAIWSDGTWALTAIRRPRRARRHWH